MLGCLQVGRGVTADLEAARERLTSAAEAGSQTLKSPWRNAGQWALCRSRYGAEAV